MNASSSTSQFAVNLHRVRELAHRRLSQLARNVSPPTETFVFRNGHFHAVRFEVGDFAATWELSEFKVTILHGSNVVEQAPLEMDAPMRKAA